VNGRSNIYFLQGPGGTGKTFVENLILAGVRKQGKIAIAVASSEIAALLLTGGRTAHSRSKIPNKITGDSILSITKQIDLAELLRRTGLIIWNEAPMQHSHCAEERCHSGNAS
jgi:hypothetical protein